MTDTASTVETFDARYTPEGRLRRYAQGRLRSFWSRQILTLSGSVFLVFLVSPMLGATACALALLGEALDCLLLRRVPLMLNRGVPFVRVRLWTTVTGGVQALTISGAVALSWFNTPHEGGTFFTLAYLTGAVINAGIVLPFHPAATLARLGMYASCVVLLFAHMALFALPDPPELMIFDLLGATMMAYMAHIFVRYMVQGFARQRQNRRDALLRSEDLARAYAELRENQKDARRLSLVARHAMDSVIMSDAEGRIQWVNHTFEKVTGYSMAEVLGHRPSEFLNGPETSMAVSDQIAAAIGAGRSHRAEILNYRKDGQKIWMEITLVPVLDETGAVETVVSVERDVTQARKHAQELARAKLDAEAATRAKSDFLATMSHEIRTPMNGVIGMADLLCEADLPPTYHDYAETIRHSAEALLTILNDILDLSKLEAGRVELNPIDFDPGACLDNVVRLLRSQASARGLYLGLETDGVPPHLRGDDTRLRQVLLNVIGNAVKFTETGGVTVHARARPEGDDWRLRIEIRDTGVGIPQDRLDHIFDPFAQADAATTRRFGGTGLGLSISRRLCEAMGGSISARSEPGVGSCFVIELPMARALGPGAEGGSALSDDGLPEALTVLVAEDNSTNRKIIEKFLQKTPIRLLFALDGVEAIEMVQNHQPDIVYMDMAMPRMDGLTATRHIRDGSGPQPRIVALTANGFASDRAACLAAGMDGFLTKPLRKADLYRNLSEMRPTR